MPTSSGPATSQPATRSLVTGGVNLRAQPCLVPLPASWQRAEAAAQLWHNRTISSVPVAPAPGVPGVVVEVDTASTSTFVIRGAGQRELDSFGPVPRANGNGGVGASFGDSTRLAFVYQTGAGESLQDDWTLYLWDQPSHKLTAIAHNPVNSAGVAVRGGFVTPLLSGNYVYWIQASVLTAAGQPGSALMQYDITTGVTRVMSSGLVTAFTVYHNELLLAAASRSDVVASDGNPTPEHILALDPTNGHTLTAPSGLDLGSDEPYQMVTNGDLVVWDDPSTAGLQAWRPEWQATKSLLPTSDAASSAIQNIVQPENLTLVGDYLIWNSPATYALDLRSDSITALTVNNGEVSTTGNSVELWQYASASPPKAPDGPYDYSAYLMDPRSLPELPNC